MIIHSPFFSGSITQDPNHAYANLSGSFTGSFKGVGDFEGLVADSVEFDNILNKPTLVSGSSQVSYPDLSNIPSGIISSSAQIDALFNIDGLVSGASQIEFNDVNNTPFSQSAASVTVSKSIIPTSVNVDLGSSAVPFRDLYLSSASLYIDGQQVLSSNNTELIITTDANQSLKLVESGADTITLQSEDGDIVLVATGNGTIELNAPIQIVAGNQILSSDGNAIQIGEDISVTGNITVTGNVDGVDVAGLKSSFDTLNGKSLVSGSSQINYSSISSIPSGIISGSSQVTSLIPTGTISGSSQVNADSITNFDTNVKDKLNTDTVVSGSSQILSLVSIDEDNMATNSDTKLPTQQSVKTYVDNKVSALVDSAPGALDTLNELAAALGDDANFSTTLSNTIAGKVSQSLEVISGDGLTGGGNLTTNRTLAVGAGDGISVSADAVAVDGTVLRTNGFGVVSGSSQVSYPNLSNIPSGIVSGSSQITPLLPSGVVSGSGQIDITSTTGTLDISSRTNLAVSDTSNVDMILTGDTLSANLKGGVVSGSAQITSLLPTGVVSGSSQVVYTSLSSIPSGIVSGSSQITPLLPSGVVSGSSQVNADSITNFDNNVLSYNNSLAVVSGSASQVKTFLSLGNVTNESKATMFTNAALTGTPTAPTPADNDNSTNIATTAFVMREVSDLIGGAGAAFDTLLEISASLAAGDSNLNGLVDGKLAKSENLNDLTNKSTARTNLGVAIGTDVQAYNSTLAAVAGGTYSGDDSITTIGTVTAGSVTAILPSGVVSGSTQVLGNTGIVSGSSQINHDSTTGFVANEHIDHSTVSVTAGNGLTGGGTIAATRTLNVVGTADRISVSADAVDIASTYVGQSSITTIGTVTAGSVTAILPSGVVSGSTQVTPLLPSGVVSGSAQIDSLGFLKVGGDGVVSGSSQITLSGDITGTANNTAIGTGVIVNADVNASAAIAYTKLNLGGSNIVSGSSQITITQSQISDLDHYTDTDFDNRLATKTTTNLSEGTNLYYTDARVKTKLNVEGVTSGSAHILALVSIDEDEMTSNSATKLPTQQSVKTYVDSKVAGLVDSAPDALNTLNELAQALGDDANFATTISTTIGGKVSQSLQIISGNGLTGGGNLTTDRTLNVVGTADRISVSADAVDIASTYVGQSSITTLGTITTGVWNGSVITSAYLDADTAHLSGTQTFSGAKSFSSAVNIDSIVASTTTGTGALIVDGGVGIAGALNVGGDVVAYASSDRRLKDNIQNIENPIEKVQKLNGVTWDWNSNADELQQSLPNVGVIAQEVEEVFPQLVHDRENGFKGVDYAKLTGLLIEAIKEQQKQIDDLKSRLQ